MTDRYADSETIDHIIDLRRRLAEAERQRDNALAFVNRMRKFDVHELRNLAETMYWNAKDRQTEKLAALMIENLNDEERDC